MIRALRSLTSLLGKFGFRTFIIDHDEIERQRPTSIPRARPPWNRGIHYGLYLKEAKDVVERYLDRKSR